MSGADVWSRRDLEPPVVTADVLHRRVGALVDDLRRVVNEVPDHHLHDEWGDHPHTLAEQLGLLGRAGAIVADQLAAWRAGRRSVLGGPAAHLAEMEDALARAHVSAYEPLRMEADRSWRRLRSEIHELDDRHLRTTVNDADRGREPLVTWLATEVLQPGRAFEDALCAMLDEIKTLWPADWTRDDYDRAGDDV